MFGPTYGERTEGMNLNVFVYTQELVDAYLADRLLNKYAVRRNAAGTVALLQISDD